tara:strand:- start:1052 stop:1423 length:372 start_codon:yes stop_codon:yes gene_type:complete
MKKVFFLVFLMSVSFGLIAQENVGLANKLKAHTKKGDYIVLELRLNKEDEFRTMEGGKSSLARIAVYTGENEGAELVVKGFEGMNSVLKVLNDLKRNDFRLMDVYSIKGESLIITHYVLEREK